MTSALVTITAKTVSGGGPTVSHSVTTAVPAEGMSELTDSVATWLSFEFMERIDIVLVQPRTTCTLCGDDEVCEGMPACSDCLELLS